VRAETLPLVFSVMGAQALARGARVQVRLGSIDPIALDVHGTITEVLAAVDTDETDDAGEDADLDAGPLAIAVDVDEAESPENPDAP
jgi:exoribonuclease-2